MKVRVIKGIGTIKDGTIFEVNGETNYMYFLDSGGEYSLHCLKINTEIVEEDGEKYPPVPEGVIVPGELMVDFIARQEEWQVIRAKEQNDKFIKKLNNVCGVVADIPTIKENNRLRKVYIAHPLTTHGTIEDNQKRIDCICKKLLNNYPEIVPISPIHAFSFFDPTGDQSVVIGLCKELLASCDELWLHGDWKNSKGCVAELVCATDHGIPVKVIR